jgi:hypothetical protein
VIQRLGGPQSRSGRAVLAHTGLTEITDLGGGFRTFLIKLVYNTAVLVLSSVAVVIVAIIVVVVIVIAAVVVIVVRTCGEFKKYAHDFDREISIEEATGQTW